MSINDTISQKLATIAANSPRVYAAGEAKGGQVFLREQWETLQNGGNRRVYQDAFSDGTLNWTDEVYNPLYPLICSGNIYAATNIFYSNQSITDTKVPIHIIGCRADSVFNRCRNLKRIVELYLENVIRFSNAFLNCDALEELNVTGTIDVNGFDVQYSTKLNRASIESIVNVLSASTTGLTVTVSLNAVKKAFETSAGANDGNTSAEWTALVATKTNWTISLV